MQRELANCLRLLSAQRGALSFRNKSDRTVNEQDDHSLALIEPTNFFGARRNFQLVLCIWTAPRNGLLFFLQEPRMYRRNIEYRRASALKPHPKDVRNHPAGQIRRLGESIAHYRITNPILWTKTMSCSLVTLGSRQRRPSASQKSRSSSCTGSAMLKAQHFLLDNKIRRWPRFRSSCRIVVSTGRRGPGTLADRI